MKDIRAVIEQNDVSARFHQRGMCAKWRNSMKRKTVKEILAESFREVAETKPIDKITIRDIVDNCGYEV